MGKPRVSQLRKWVTKKMEPKEPKSEEYEIRGPEREVDSVDEDWLVDILREKGGSVIETEVFQRFQAQCERWSESFPPKEANDANIATILKIARVLLRSGLLSETKKTFGDAWIALQSDEHPNEKLVEMAEVLFNAIEEAEKERGKKQIK